MFENLYSTVFLMSVFPPFFNVSFGRGAFSILKTIEYNSRQSLWSFDNSSYATNSDGLGSKALGSRSGSYKACEWFAFSVSVFQSVQWEQYFPYPSDRYMVKIKSGKTTGVLRSLWSRYTCTHYVLYKDIKCLYGGPHFFKYFPILSTGNGDSLRSHLKKIKQ